MVISITITVTQIISQRSKIRMVKVTILMEEETMVNICNNNQKKNNNLHNYNNINITKSSLLLLTLRILDSYIRDIICSCLLISMEIIIMIVLKSRFSHKNRTMIIMKNMVKWEMVLRIVTLVPMIIVIFLRISMKTIILLVMKGTICFLNSNKKRS